MRVKKVDLGECQIG